MSKRSQLRNDMKQATLRITHFIMKVNLIIVHTFYLNFAGNLGIKIYLLLRNVME